MKKTRLMKLITIVTVFVMMLGLMPYSAAMTVEAASQADDIVAIALAEEGYAEGSNNDNKYGEYFNHNNVAWCAYFVSWCARQAGIPTSVIKTNAWAGSMGSSAGTGNFGGQYYPKGSITPQKGDIVYYGWGSSTSKHVEIVISVNESSNTFTSIGGNTSGDAKESEGVRRHSNYSFTSSQIVGFERPAYENVPVETHWYDGYTPIDLGTEFYAYIINTYAWKHLTNDGPNVSMRTETGDLNQIWKFTRDGDGAYKIMNCADNLVLDIYNFGTTNGTNVAVGSNNDSTAQRFYIYGESGAYYLRGKCGDLVLDVNGGSTEDGTNVQMWEKTESTAQKFQIWKLQTELSVTAGNRASKTLFSWSANNSSFDFYDVKIWNGTYWVGDPYHIEWGITDNKFEIELPAGYYEAYVDARFDSNIIMSNVVAFTVEENYFGKPTLSVASGNQNAKTHFSWTEVEKANIYHVKIWNGTYWEGDIYHSGWGLTGTSYDVDLPPGYYEAYVDAANDDVYQMSNVVSFTVEEAYNPADLNQNGSTTILDAVLLQKHLLHLKSLTAEQSTLADINQDGKVNVFDLCQLKALLQ